MLAIKDSRLDRLVGDALASDDEGGSLPLSQMCGIIFQYMDDQAQAVAPASLQNVLHTKLSAKDQRVRHNYRHLEGDPWTLLVADLLDQFADRELVKPENGGLILGTKFEFKKVLVVVPARPKKNRAVAVTIFPKEERAAFGAAANRVLEIRAAASALQPDGPGLLAIERKRVQVLKRAMCDDEGRPYYDQRFPIIVDQHGRILDGRHRAQAAREVGLEPAKQTVNVESDADALAYAFRATIVRWSARDIQKLADRLLAPSSDMEGILTLTSRRSERERIAIYISAYPHWPDREIADKIGCEGVIVARVRNQGTTLESGPLRPRTRRKSKREVPLANRPLHLESLPKDLFEQLEAGFTPIGTEENNERG